MTKQEVIEPAKTITMLRMFNFVTILQLVVMALLFIGPAGRFMRPTTPPDPWWLSLTFSPGFELWDLLFVVAAGLLVYSTIKLRWVVFSHLFAAVSWGLLGLLWVLGFYVTDPPGYLLGAGLFAIFIASQHVAIAGVWKAEGVN